MKINRLRKDLEYGQWFGKAIKSTSSKDDMAVIRCILGKDLNNVPGVLKFIGDFPARYNKAIGTGILIELIK